MKNEKVNGERRGNVVRFSVVLGSLSNGMLLALSFEW